MNKKLIFMGTGPFALATLEGLWESLEEGDSLCVYTKAAKPQGRGMVKKDGAVAQFAREKGLALYQPITLRDEAAREQFLSLKPDLVVVASYGLILPSYVLDTPEYGCVNVHASLLPRYRGAAPINRAVMNGDALTGVTLMKMDEGLDTGDILLTRSLAIGKNDTAGEVHDKLAEIGRDLLLEALPAIYRKALKPRAQDESEACYAAKITAEDQRLDFTLSTDQIHNTVRGLSPVPVAWCRTEKDGKLLKIHAAAPADTDEDAEPGVIVCVKGKVLVKTGDGALELITVQPEGKGRMSALDAVNGRRLTLGDKLL